MVLSAIISDIHGNMQALEAVVVDARREGAERFYCLGDIVGYGAQPVECLEIVREISSVTIQGNHEYAVLHGPAGFNRLASEAVFWTRRQLEAGSTGMTDGLDYIGGLGDRADLEQCTLVHGSPRHPRDEYLFREDTIEFLPQRQDFSSKLEGCFQLIDQPCFVGHTHVPGVIDDTWHWVAPAGCPDGYDTEGRACLVNVGSVGQPRDGNHGASYALFDGKTVQFRRVTYDVASAARRIFDEADLPDMLGQRLLEAW